MSTHTYIKVSAAMLPIADLVPQTARNPRSSLGNVEELADSIRVHGILQPLVVAPSGDRYRIIAGHRRHAAALIAGLTAVPCVVREGQPPSADPTLMIVENLQREDLAPLDAAHALDALRREHTLTEVARMTGLSVGTISARLRLLDLPEDAQALVQDGSLTLGQADSLARQVRARGKGHVHGKLRTHFRAGHPLAGPAAALCEHTDTAASGRQVYGPACGPCWERTIRDDALGVLDQDGRDVDEVVVQRLIAGTHDGPTTVGERRESVRRLHARQYSDRAIAARTGLSDKTVLRHRQILGLPGIEEPTTNLRSINGGAA